MLAVIIIIIIIIIIMSLLQIVTLTNISCYATACCPRPLHS